MSSQTSQFFVTGGTLRRDADCYVIRRADRELHSGLKAGKFCYVLTSRQMGKSSLMVRTAASLREEGCGVVILDLTAIGQNLSAEQWYRGLLDQMGDHLELEDELIEFWRANKELGAMQRWMRAIREAVLPRYPGPVVIFIDEIDAVLSLPFSTDEFFAAIREFYNRRTEDEELSRLTFCLLGVASPSDLIRDTRTTPFNIGQRIELHDFAEAEALSLSRGLRLVEKAGVMLVKRIHYWTGGHPYLTQRLCQAIADTSPHSEQPAAPNLQSIDRFCEEMFFSSRAQERDDNLLFVRERMLHSEVDLPSLLQLYDQVRRGKRVHDDAANPLMSVLRLSGIARVEAGRLRKRNRIYARVFDREWIKANMPDAEVRRQRAAYRRGLLRAAGVAVAIIALMAVLVWFAIRERNVAKQAQAEALSRELAANAVVHLPSDPELSLLLAIEALRIEPTSQAEDALRQALPESHVETAMRGHTSAVSSALFSPDGKLVVTASFDQTARVWESSTGRGVAELHGHTGYAAFSPDSKLVVTAGQDHIGRVWQANTGQCLAQLPGHTEPLTNVAFSHDGKLIMTTSYDKTARVWETSTGKELAVLRGHLGTVWSGAFSPDGRFVVTASADKTARVWATRTWKKVAELRGHTSSVGVVNTPFSPDAKLLLTSSDDGTVRVWEVGAWRCLAILRGHTPGLPTRAVFSLDGQLILTSSHDGTARLWETRTWRGLKELRGHTSRIGSMAFSPDSKLVLTKGYDEARIWEVSTGRTWKELRGEPVGANSAGESAFSPDGKWAVTGLGIEARVWAVNRSNLPTELRGHTEALNSATFSPDGKFVVTASEDKTARVWEASTGQSLKELRGHTNEVWAAEFSPDGKLIVTASDDKTARIWEASTGESLLELRGHTNRVFSASFSPDGQRVVTASHDGTALIWEARAGRCLIELRGHTDQVISARFSPDGKRVVTGSYDGTARIWEVSTGRCLIVLSVLPHAERVYAAFSPDGQWVVTGSEDNTVLVWEVSTGCRVRELRGHTALVKSVAFSPDGRFIVAASADGTARVWDASTGQRVALLREHADSVNGAAFSPDGKYIATASRDKTARIYPCEVCRPIEEVLALARTRVTRGLTPEERARYLHQQPSQ